MSCQTPNNIKNRQGFTLVEVLIVLVIISIMTGLLITVIDPLRQRQRAQDGTIVASANKIIATITAYHSATGRYPTCSSLLEDLQNEVAIVACSSGQWTFTINGVTFPATCDATLRYAPGAAGCGFRYEVDSTGGAACLGVRFHRDANVDGNTTLGRYLLWRSSTGQTIDEITDEVTSGSCNVVP